MSGEAEDMPVLSVTDHALVRWMERVEGLDLEPFREALRRVVDASGLGLAVAREGEAKTIVDLPAMGLFILIQDGCAITVRPWGNE